MGDENDQLKTPAEADEDMASVADKPDAPAESGETGKGYSIDSAKRLKTTDVPSRETPRNVKGW